MAATPPRRYPDAYTFEIDKTRGVVPDQACRITVVVNNELTWESSPSSIVETMRPSTSRESDSASRTPSSRCSPVSTRGTWSHAGASSARRTGRPLQSADW